MFAQKIAKKGITFGVSCTVCGNKNTTLNKYYYSCITIFFYKLFTNYFRNNLPLLLQMLFYFRCSQVAQFWI